MSVCNFSDEEKYIENFEKVYQMFPDAKFDIAIDFDDLDNIVTNEKHMVIKHVNDCRCYKKTNIKTRFFFIQGDKLTNKFIINELIKQGLTLDCDHRFLEGFHKLPDSDVQYELVIGS